MQELEYVSAGYWLLLSLVHSVTQYALQQRHNITKSHKRDSTVPYTMFVQECL